MISDIHAHHLPSGGIIPMHIASHNTHPPTPTPTPTTYPEAVHEVELEVVREEGEEVRRGVELGREALPGEVACQLCEGGVGGRVVYI